LTNRRHRAAVPCEEDDFRRGGHDPFGKRCRISYEP
jgi:hypothetical protein